MIRSASSIVGLVCIAVGLVAAACGPSPPAISTPPPAPAPAGSDRSGAPPANGLVGQSSAYLSRQAHSRVQWRPWGPGALEEAVRLHRPIFLVIGFASCPGCRLLEKGPFDDAAVASSINEHFVPVLVDRDERPDLDAAYMAAVRVRSGGGGWPALLFLTSDGLPFEARSYGPAAGPGPELPGLIDKVLLDLGLGDEAVAMKAAELTERVRNLGAPRPPGELPPASATFAALLFQTASIFDREDGGFGDSPRFVRQPLIDFLLRYHRRSSQSPPLEMAETTLEAVRESPLHDSAAGGFFRYARGPDWQNPSGEKSLADNALMATVFVDAWKATGRDDFRDTARSTVEFLLRDLADPAFPGAFAAALDTESGGSNGGPAARDDKVLADANGLALSALARSAAAFANDGYRGAAMRSGDFLLTRMMPGGRPIHCLEGDGKACPDGYLDDSVFMASGFLDLFELDSDPRWLSASLALADDMLARFEHKGSGGFFFTSSADDNVLLRAKPDFDGAQSSGNAGALLLLLRLDALTGIRAYREAALRTLKAFSHVLAYRVLAAPGLASGLEAWTDTFKQIFVLVPPGADASALLAVIARADLPNRTLVVTPTGPRLAALQQLVPALGGKQAVDGAATAFVCEERVCRPAATDPQALAASLTTVLPLPPD